MTRLSYQLLNDCMIIAQSNANLCMCESKWKLISVQIRTAEISSHSIQNVKKMQITRLWTSTGSNFLFEICSSVSDNIIYLSKIKKLNLLHVIYTYSICIYTNLFTWGMIKETRSIISLNSIPQNWKYILVLFICYWGKTQLSSVHEAAETPPCTSKCKLNLWIAIKRFIPRFISVLIQERRNSSMQAALRHIPWGINWSNMMLAVRFLSFQVETYSS